MTEDIQVTSKHELAFKYLQRLKDLLKGQAMSFLETGRLLKEIRDRELYKFIGDGYQSFTELLGDPEVGISQSRAYAYIEIFEVFVIKYKISLEDLSVIPWDKIRMILPVSRKAKNIGDVEDYIAKARTLSRSDLAIEVGEVEEGKVQMPKTRVIKLLLHEKCGKYRPLHMSINDICHCKEI